MLRVICIGNGLHGDDAVGETVFNELSNDALPDNVELIDGGTAGMTLLPFFINCQHVLIVDLIKQAQGEEGQTVFYEDVFPLLPEIRYTGEEHGGDIVTLLNLLPHYTDALPKVSLIGLTSSSRTTPFEGMSPQIAAGIDGLCEEIRCYITQISNVMKSVEMTA